MPLVRSTVTIGSTCNLWDETHSGATSSPDEPRSQSSDIKSTDWVSHTHLAETAVGHFESKNPVVEDSDSCLAGMKMLDHRFRIFVKTI